MQYKTELLSKVINTKYELLTDNDNWENEKVLEFGRSLFGKNPVGLITVKEDSLVIDGNKRMRAIQRIFSENSGFYFDMFTTDHEKKLIFGNYQHVETFIAAHHMVKNTETAVICRLLKSLDYDIDEGNSVQCVNNFAAYFAKLREIELIFAIVETSNPLALHNTINELEL